MSKDNKNIDHSSCGCGCETTSSMKSFLIDSKKTKHNHSEGCCGKHSHDHNHEDCCKTHIDSENSLKNDDSCCESSHKDETKKEIKEDEQNEDCCSEHTHEHKHDHDHEHGESSCGCGCETTSSMKSFLISKKSETKKLDKKEDCCSERTHEHKHDHEHSESSCGCGCETTSSMKSFLINEKAVHNEHNHKHDEQCKCTCDYCESMSIFLMSKDEHSHNHSHEHEIENKNILILATILILLGFILEKFSLLPNVNMQRVLMAIFSLASYFLMGRKTIKNAFKNIQKGDWFGESFLMTVATFGAIIIGEYPEAAAVMLLFNIGEYFQSRAVDKSRRSISELMDIIPDFANIIDDKGNTKVVDPQELKVGDIILIKPGEKIPVDSIIVEGASTIDNKALTGESIPLEVCKDTKLLSGAINISSLIKVKVEKEFGESTVSKILELVQNASEKKSTQEKFITRFSKIYTPIVVAMAFIIAFIVPFITNQPFSMWIHRSLVFLVVSCPCALVISVPLSFFAGIGGASKRGILFKGSTYIEQLSQVKSIMFDKTGTLTKGQFEVSEIFEKNGFTKQEVLEKAAFVEINSNHPIAKSIVNEYVRTTNKTIQNQNMQLEEISGFGIKAKINEDVFLVGNAKLMASNNIIVEDEEFDTTVIYIAKNNELMGIISIEDKIKDDSKSAIQELNSDGINTIMLTGDNEKIAQKVAKTLGIKKYFAELLPQNKVEKIEEIISNSKSEKVAFAGDGINDAPVLARADVGIAMGGVGSDAAIEAADVVLMTDEISKVIEAIKISRKTMTVARQNIIFAIGIKIVVMALGVLGLANMWIAVFADVGVSIIAIINAMRAYKTQK